MRAHGNISSGGAQLTNPHHATASSATAKPCTCTAEDETTRWCFSEHALLLDAVPQPNMLLSAWQYCQCLHTKHTANVCSCTDRLTAHGMHIALRPNLELHAAQASACCIAKQATFFAFFCKIALQKESVWSSPEECSSLQSLLAAIGLLRVLKH